MHIIFLMFFFFESNKGMEHLYHMKCKNRVPLYDLLLEMLDAQRFQSPGKLQQLWEQSEKDPPSTPTTSSSSSPSRGPGAMQPNTACLSPDPWSMYRSGTIYNPNSCKMWRLQTSNKNCDSKQCCLIVFEGETEVESLLVPYQSPL